MNMNFLRSSVYRTDIFTDHRDIKLNQACHVLRETSLSNLAICELVGYESPEHFMRTFKKTYGMTPGEYRKKNRE